MVFSISFVSSTKATAHCVAFRLAPPYDGFLVLLAFSDKAISDNGDQVVRRHHPLYLISTIWEFEENWYRCIIPQPYSVFGIKWTAWEVLGYLQPSGWNAEGEFLIPGLGGEYKERMARW